MTDSEMTHAGGCLCGAVRFELAGPPDWVTICFCRFCQKATGTEKMIEPIFPVAAHRITRGAPARYTHVSGGSGREVYVHFCATCASKLWLTFDRWPDRLGVYAGAFDDPGWFPITPGNTKYIFRAEAPRGTLIPAGFRVYDAHAATADGTPLEPEILSEVQQIGR